MPGKNRTGPEGHGPMTGKGAGNCTEKSVSRFRNLPYGFGFQQGMDFGCGGWGRRKRFYATPADTEQYPERFVPAISKKEELEILRNQTKYLEDNLKEIRRRIKELEAETKDESNKT